MSDVHDAVLERLREVRGLYDALMQRALQLANITFADMDTAPTSSSRARRYCWTT